MTKNDLDAIEREGYIRDGFGSLGIVAGKPLLMEDGSIGVNCYGIDLGDVDVVADRIAQRMGRKGWSVDVWIDEAICFLKIDYHEKGQK